MFTGWWWSTGGAGASLAVRPVSGAADPASIVSSARNGHLIAKIAVGNGPHGLCVWPQPGRYSLGHTGILR